MDEAGGRTVVTARQLVSTTRSALARYAKAESGRLELRGRIADVTTVAGEIVVLVRAIEGLGRDELCSATIGTPSPGCDRLLESIGRNGRITLTGNGRAEAGPTAALRMTDIENINGRTPAELAAEPRDPADPETAAGLVRRVEAGLERYKALAPVWVRVEEQLGDVENEAENEICITVRRMPGLPRDDFCLAWIAAPTAAADEVLQAVGAGGPIALTGRGSGRSGEITKVLMHHVERIEGAARTVESPGRPAVHGRWF